MADPRKLGAQCDKCPRNGRVPVFGEGPRNPKAVILGQDPGREETKQGRPFVGPTGERLNQVWKAACDKNAIQISREETYITNACLCLPIDKNDNKEARSACDACRPRLLAELERLDAVPGVLALGRWAWYALTGEATGITKKLGFHSAWGKTWVVPTIHPAATFRREMDLNPLQAHVDGFVRRLARGLPGEPVLKKNPKAHELDKLVEDCKRLGKPLAVDIENVGHHGTAEYALIPKYAKLTIVGVGADIGTGVGFSWAWPPSYPVLQALKRAFADPDLSKVACNGIGHDFPILRNHGFEINGELIDIRDARRALVSTSKVSLNYQAGIYLTVEPWKHLADFEDKDA